MPRRQHRPKPLIPNWFPSSHPLNLPGSVRRSIGREFNPDAVFLNIPYARRYTNLEVAMISTLTAYGLIPRMAKTRVGLEVRLHKIAALMLGCGYGVTVNASVSLFATSRDGSNNIVRTSASGCLF